MEYLYYNTITTTGKVLFINLSCNCSKTHHKWYTNVERMIEMELNKYIDHTLLKADATEAQIDQLCDEAKAYAFASVCVNGYWVKHCHTRLQDSGVLVCTVVGFPLGASVVKPMETAYAIAHGADEIDMVINIGELKEGHDEVVYQDIYDVVQTANGRCVKVILETCLLTKDEIKRACTLSVRAGATFVKTSTGFSSGGAVRDDVAFMKTCVNGKCLVKASGGIRTLSDMKQMMEAGADRIGASAGVTIMEEYQQTI